MSREKELISLLTELCVEQHKVLNFVNKINYSVTKEQWKLDEHKRNKELLNLAWGTNDCIADNPRQHEIIGILEREFGVGIR